MNSAKIKALVVRAIYFVLHFLATILINRTLTPSMKGEYAYAINFVSILSIFGSLGLDLLYLEYKKKYGEEVTGTFIFLSLVSSATLLIIGIIVHFLGGSLDAFMICLLSAMHLLSQNVSLMSCSVDIKKRNLIVLEVQIVYVLFLVIIWSNGIMDLALFLILYFINDAAVFLMLILRNRYRINIHFLKINGVKSTTLKILSQGFNAMLISLLIVFNYNLDVIMMRYMKVNFSDIGIYSVGVTLSNIIILIPDAFKEISIGDVVHENAAIKVQKYIRICLLLMSISLVAFLFVGKFFVVLFYGQAYQEAYNVTLILFIGDMFMCLYKLIHPLFIADGKRWKVLLYLLIAVGINAFANYIVIPIYGKYGAAWASVVSYFATGLMFYFSFKYNYFSKKKIESRCENEYETKN